MDIKRVDRAPVWDLVRCYDSQVIVRALVASVVLTALAFLGKRFEPGSAGRVAVGLGETLVFGYLVVITLMPISRLDEMYQRIHLIAIAGAFGLVGIVGTGLEFLARAGVHVPAFGVWMWVLMMMAWALGVVIVSRRYR